MPSNHTTIGAWVNSKMSGERPTVKLYKSINRYAGTPNKTKTKDMISLNYSSICYIPSTDRMGVDEGNLQDTGKLTNDYSSTVHTYK